MALLATLDARTRWRWCWHPRRGEVRVRLIQQGRHLGDPSSSRHDAPMNEAPQHDASQNDAPADVVGSQGVTGPIDRVMVGTDRSETAERAVEWGAPFANASAPIFTSCRSCSARRTRVRPRTAPPRPRGPPVPRKNSAPRAQIAGERGYGRVVVNEDPALALVQAAETDAIDVLVVGNAGMAGRKEFLLGNVPNRITHNARCHGRHRQYRRRRRERAAPASRRIASQW